MKKINFFTALLILFAFVFAACGNIAPTVPEDESVKPETPGWYKYEAQNKNGEDFIYYIRFDKDGKVEYIGDEEKELTKLDKSNWTYKKCSNGSEVSKIISFEKCSTAALPDWTSPTQNA